MTIFVLGRFPPPLDGQTVATERLARLLEATHDVITVDTEPDAAQPKGLLSRAAHFTQLRPRLREVLSEDPRGTVLWPSISPDPLGHFRDLLVSSAAVQKGQRLYAVVHRGNFRKLFESPLTSRTAVRLVQRLNGIVFNTQHLSNDCARWIPDAKRHIIPNAIDRDVEFTDAEINRKRLKRRERPELRLIFVGHMIASKGYLDVLATLERLRARDLDVRVDFVGRWNSSGDRTSFMSRVQAQGLESRVTHHGAVHSRPALKRLYATADVLIFPTYYPSEAQPLVVIEALNAGLPIVSTRHAGIPEMVRDGEEGFLVEPRDDAGLAEAVASLVDLGTWERISEGARRRYVAVYSPDAVRQKWLDLLE